MRITRILAVSVLAIALWSASTTAAFADDLPPVDPPPASDPPPAPEPAPTVPLPESAPYIEPPSSTPAGVFIAPPSAPEAPPSAPPKTLEQLLAESHAIVQSALAGIFAYGATHPGASSLEYIDGVWRDSSGNIVDLDGIVGNSGNAAATVPVATAPSVFPPVVATLETVLSSASLPVVDATALPDPTEEDPAIIVSLSLALLALAIYRGGRWARPRDARAP